MNFFRTQTVSLQNRLLYVSLYVLYIYVRNISEPGSMFWEVYDLYNILQWRSLKKIKFLLIMSTLNTR